MTTLALLYHLAFLGGSFLTFFVGAYTLAVWAEGRLYRLVGQETPAERDRREQREVAVSYAVDHAVKLARAEDIAGDTADICVQALERALEAMHEGDKKLAEREIEYVLEQIDAA